MVNPDVKTPCQADPEAWVGDDPALRAEAAEACHWCPALEACRRAADAGREQWGVWAGQDRSPHPYTGRGRPRKDVQLPAPPAVKTCPHCGTEFTRGKRSRAEWAMKATCSRACTWHLKRKQKARVAA